MDPRLGREIKITHESGGKCLDVAPAPGIQEIIMFYHTAMRLAAQPGYAFTGRW